MTSYLLQIVSNFSWNEYPTAGAAGLFLIIISIGFVFVWLFPKYYSIFMGLSFGLAALGAYVGYLIFPELGKIRLVDIVVYSFCLVVEIVGIIWASKKINNERELDAMILLIVSFHFLPMTLILGPLILILSTLCLINAVYALKRLHIPIFVFGLVDSSIKFIVGLLMLWIYAF